MAFSLEEIPRIFTSNPNFKHFEVILLKVIFIKDHRNLFNICFSSEMQMDDNNYYYTHVTDEQ